MDYGNDIVSNFSRYSNYLQKKYEESIKKSAIHKKEYNMQYQNAFLGTLLSIEMMFFFCMGKKITFKYKEVCAYL